MHRRCYYFQKCMDKCHVCQKGCSPVFMGSCMENQGPQPQGLGKWISRLKAGYIQCTWPRSNRCCRLCRPKGQALEGNAARRKGCLTPKGAHRCVGAHLQLLSPYFNVPFQNDCWRSMALALKFVKSLSIFLSLSLPEVLRPFGDVCDSPLVSE